MKIIMKKNEWKHSIETMLQPKSGKNKIVEAMIQLYKLLYVHRFPFVLSIK